MLPFTFRPWSIRKSQPNKISLSNGVHTTRKKWIFSVNDRGSIRGGGGGGGVEEDLCQYLLCQIPLMGPRYNTGLQSLQDRLALLFPATIYILLTFCVNLKPHYVGQHVILVPKVYLYAKYLVAVCGLHVIKHKHCKASSHVSCPTQWYTIIISHRRNTILTDSH